MKISLAVVAITVLLSVACFYAEARPNKNQKTLEFLRKLHNRMLNTRLVRSVLYSQEEDEEYEEDEEEGWGSQEDSEMFMNIFDRNNDGMIDEPELWAFFEAMSYDEVDIKQMVENIFRMDHDHDAYLSVEEISNAMVNSLL